jgi:hypothetical protein
MYLGSYYGLEIPFFEILSVEINTSYPSSILQIFKRIFSFFTECGKWSLSADVTSLLAGSISASPGKKQPVLFNRNNNKLRYKRSSLIHKLAIKVITVSGLQLL